MATTFAFRLATTDDDGQLRQLLRDISLPGTMELASRREPEFFRAERLGSLSAQVFVCETAGGRIVGFGVRSVRQAFLNGQATRVSYLSSLRSLPAVRNGLLLVRGHQYVRQLEAADPVSASMTTIYDDNLVARTILTSGRAGLPKYHPAGSLRTYAISLQRHRHQAIHQTMSGEQLGPSDVTDLLNRNNARWQFAPWWEPEDLSGASGRMDGFKLANLRVRSLGSSDAVSCGVWDPLSVKQIVVNRYRWPLSWYRAISPLASAIGIGPYLPRVRGELRLLYGCCISGPESTPERFAEVLDEIIDRWSGQGYHYLMIGLVREHPYSVVVAKRAQITLRSTVYRIGWLDTPGMHPISNDRSPYLEIATL